jgi:hypothetical protein
VKNKVYDRVGRHLTDDALERWYNMNFRGLSIFMKSSAGRKELRKTFKHKIDTSAPNQNLKQKARETDEKATTNYNSFVRNVANPALEKGRRFRSRALEKGRNLGEKYGARYDRGLTTIATKGKNLAVKLQMDPTIFDSLDSSSTSKLEGFIDKKRDTSSSPSGSYNGSGGSTSSSSSSSSSASSGGDSTDRSGKSSDSTWNLNEIDGKMSETIKNRSRSAADVFYEQAQKQSRAAARNAHQGFDYFFYKRPEGTAFQFGGGKHKYYTSL